MINANIKKWGGIIIAILVIFTVVILMVARAPLPSAPVDAEIDYIPYTLNDADKIYGENLTISSLLYWHNRIREDKGLSPLKLDERLSNAAYTKALYMLSNDCWGHLCGEEDNITWDALKSNSKGYTKAAENLAKGVTTNSKAMDGWMDSITHNLNITDPTFKYIGIAIKEGNYQGKNGNVLIVVVFTD